MPRNQPESMLNHRECLHFVAAATDLLLRRNTIVAAATNCMRGNCPNLIYFGSVKDIGLRDHRTHHRMTKMWFPMLDDKTIWRVNERLDNPTKQDMLIGSVRKRLIGDSAYLNGMWKGGHRQYNHDLLTMMMVSMQTGGAQGVQAGFSHLAQDWLSDQMVKTIGLDGATALEAVFNMAYGQKRRRR